MATALPAATDFTGASITEAQFKTAITSMRTYLADLLGTDGVEGTALTALMAPYSSVLIRDGSYTVTASDRGKVFNFYNSTATVTLPTIATAGVGIGFVFFLYNTTPANLTITRSGTDTIENTTSITIPSQGSCAVVVMSSSQWFALHRGAGAATESASGIVELATTAEAAAGTDTARAVTPAGALEVRKASNYDASASASSISIITVTGIPSWATRVTVAWAGITRSNVNADVYIELGDSGGIETGGVTFDAFAFPSGGVATFVNVTGNSWGFTANGASSEYSVSDTTSVLSGTKTLSGTITQINLRASTGSFSAGTVKVIWE